MSESTMNACGFDNAHCSLEETCMPASSANDCGFDTVQGMSKKLDDLKRENAVLLRIFSGLVTAGQIIHQDTDATVQENDSMIRELSGEVGAASLHQFAPLISQVEESKKEHIAARQMWSQAVSGLLDGLEEVLPQVKGTRDIVPMCGKELGKQCSEDLLPPAELGVSGTPDQMEETQSPTQIHRSKRRHRRRGKKM